MLEEDVWAHMWKYEVKCKSAQRSARALYEPDPTAYVGPYGGFDSEFCETFEQTSRTESTSLCDVEGLLVGGSLAFKYDFGSSTSLVLRLTSQRPRRPDEARFELPREPKATPSETMPVAPVAGPRLDDLFPALAAALLYPRFAGAVIGSAAEQLHGTLEGGPAHNGDQLCCPQRFATPEDFLIEADAAWAGSKWWDGASCGWTNTKVREGWEAVFCFPAAVQPAKDETKWRRFVKHAERMDEVFAAGGRGATDEERFEMCGPRTVTVRMTADDKAARVAALRAGGFEFVQAFPHTHAALSAGKYHWISLRGAVASRTLQLARGECKNDARRPAPPLCTFKKAFASLHEIMEAVEAGWAASDTGASVATGGVSRNY
jgi:hypothetical protein